MIRRASCGLLYGPINSTKTTSLGRIARYIFNRYGLTSRLISADNEYDTLENEIDEGIIEPFAVLNVPNPFPTLTKLSKGLWPTAVKRGTVTVIEMQPTPPEKMAKIGAYLIEGTTTIGELLREDHIRKARVLGQDVVGKFEEDGIVYAKAAQSHYGHVQDFVTMNLIPIFSMLPVRWVWWTGHEYTGEDEATGQMRLGPGVVGKAATMVTTRKLGNTFHMTLTEATALISGKNVRTLEPRAYFQSHPSGIGQIMWPAGVKLPVDWVAEWRARYPEGYIPLTLDSGIEQFVKYIDDKSEAAGKSRAVTVPATPPEQSMEPTSPSVPVPTAPAAVRVAPAPATPAPPPATQTRPGATPIRRPMVPPRPGPLPTPRFATAAPIQKPAAPVTTPPDKLAETLEKSIEQVTGAPVANVIPDINAVPGEQPAPAQVPQREESKTEEVK
jgi:hypothetical protein